MAELLTTQQTFTTWFQRPKWAAVSQRWVDWNVPNHPEFVLRFRYVVSFRYQGDWKAIEIENLEKIIGGVGEMYQSIFRAW